MPLIGSLGAAASRGFGQFLQKITAVLNTDAFFKYVTLLLTGNPPTSTFVTDASTNNLQVTINGDTKPNGFSPNENGYYSCYFDGTGDRILLSGSNLTFTGNFTVEAWVYIGSLATLRSILCIGDSRTSPGVLFAVSTTGKLIVFANNVAVLTGTGTSVVANTWTHVAFVRSGTTITGYVNGAVQGTATSSATFTGIASYIGFELYNSGVGAEFLGNISNLRVVDNTAVYTSAFTPSTTPLTAISGTILLACQANRFIDNSSSPKAMTVVGQTYIAGFQPFTPNPSFATYGSTVFTGSNYLQTTNSVIPTGYITSTSTLTIEAWIYQTQRQTYANACMLGDMGASGSLYWGFGPTPSGNLSFYWYSSGSYSATGNTVIPLNTWTHIAVSISSGAIKLFVNGVLQTITGTSTLTNQTGTYNYLQIGSFYTGGSGYGYFGNISNLRFISGTALYTTDFTPPTTQLTAVTNTSLLTCQTNQPVNNNVFLDSSSNNFAITRVGNTTQGSLNPYGGNWSNYFDGSGDYLNCSASSAQFGTGDFTIECWVYPTSLAAIQVIVDFRTTSTAIFGQIYLATNGTVHFYLPTDIATTNTVTLNAWNHIAISRSAGTLKMFINGTSGYSAANSGTYNAVGTYIGISISNTNGFTGYISNMRFITGTGIYTSNFTPSTTPLTAIAKTSLLTCQSNRFIDNSNNNFTITKTGDVSVQRFSPFSPVLSTPTSYSNYFDGTGDILDITGAAGPEGTQDFTFEVWWNISNMGGSYPRLFESTASLAFQMYLNGGTLGVAQNGGSIIVSYNISALTNQWLHICVTRSGANMRLFINGVLQSYSASGGVNFSASTAWRIYCEGGGPVGYASNLRIVRGSVVSAYATSVTTTGTTVFTPPTTQLTAISGTSLLTCQSSTIIDNSANNFPITVTGEVAPRSQNPFGVTNNTDAPYTPATYGGSMYFDGTGDFLNAPANASFQLTGDFTLEAWIYPTAINTFNMVFGSENGATSDYLTIRASTIELAIAAASYPAWSFTFTTNSWYHIAITRSSSSLKAFVNGTQLTLATGSATNSAQLFQTGAAFAIGRYGNTSTPYAFTGYISNARVIKNAALYKSNFAPPVAPLQAVTNTSLLLLGSNGAVYDSAMFNDAETLGDSKTSTAQSKFGGSSVAFDGTGDYLKILPSNRYQFQANYTIEFWVYFNSVTGTQDIIGNYVSNVATDWIVIMSATGIQYYPSGSSSYVYSGASSVTANTWYHVAAVRSGSTCSLYLNGVSVGTPLTFSATLGDTTKPLYIGSRGGSTNYFNGYMDDLRITNGYARYTQNFTVPTQPFPVQ